MPTAAPVFTSYNFPVSSLQQPWLPATMGISHPQNNLAVFPALIRQFAPERWGNGKKRKGKKQREGGMREEGTGGGKKEA